MPPQFIIVYGYAVFVLETIQVINYWLSADYSSERLVFVYFVNDLRRIL